MDEIDIPPELWAAVCAHAESLNQDIEYEINAFLKAYLKRKPSAQYKTPGKRARRQPGEGSFFRSMKRRPDGTIVPGPYIGRIELPRKPNGDRDYTQVESVDREKALEKFEQRKLEVAGYLERITVRRTVRSWLVPDILLLKKHERVGVVDDPNRPKTWVELKRDSWSPDYFQTILSMLRNQIVPAIGNVWLDQFGTHHVQYLLDYVSGDTGLPETLREVHKKLPDGTIEVSVKPRWSSRTVTAVYDEIHSAIELAADQRPRLIRENVVALVARPQFRSKETPSHTLEEARKLLVTALEWGDPFITLHAARYMLGWRQGELLGLEEDRLDFRKLTIERTWQLQRLQVRLGADPEDPDRFDAPDNYEVRPLYKGYALVRTKTRRKDLVPMPVPLAVLLKIYLENRLPNPFGLVWVSESFTPIRPVDDNEVWHDAAARAEVPIVPGHGSRHTANTLLDIDEATRMQILGQSTAAANRIYLHANLDRARAAMGALAEMLLPEKIIPANQLV